MMTDIIWDFSTATYPVAKKEYLCIEVWVDVVLWIDRLGVTEEDVSPEDWGIIEQALDECCKILLGQKYLKLTGKFDGEWCVFRARQKIDYICRKYGIYED